MSQTLRWGTNQQGQTLIRPGRWSVAHGQPFGPHRHDFVEVFWVEEGAGIHRVNGTDQELRIGDCVFVRADDHHEFLCPVAERLAWVNVSMPMAIHDHLRERFEDELGWWPWNESQPSPFLGRLTPGQMSALSEQMAALPMDRQRRLDAEWFMMGVLRAIAPRYRSGEESLPTWLETAVRDLASDPLRLQEGLPALVTACGRCAEHVNRTVRAHYDMTATDLLIQLRLDYAARRLRLSQDDILAIALDAGFDNLSYFYRRFKSRFGTTPRRFRINPVAG
jgi:AraC family cel operon transcriptional repressor